VLVLVPVPVPGVSPLAQLVQAWVLVQVQQLLQPP
jgi:hypothetical protein